MDLKVTDGEIYLEQSFDKANKEWKSVQVLINSVATNNFKAAGKGAASITEANLFLQTKLGAIFFIYRPFFKIKNTDCVLAPK